MPVDKMAIRFDETVREQHGLVTGAQADKLLGPNRRRRWVTQAKLVCVQPSVFRVAGSPATWHQALKAAQLASGGIVSHRSAAELWGLIPPSGHLEISIRPDQRPRLHPPAVAHRIKDLHPELARDREGLALTDPVRTVIDLGLVSSTWEVGDAVSRGITTKLFSAADVDRLREALGRPGRNGTGVMRRVLEERSFVTGFEESELERRMTGVARKFGLPPMTIQHEVWHAGRFIARIDAAYPDQMIAIELDGYLHHSSPDAFQRDRTRQNRLVALGWTVLRFTWDDVVKRPADVARTIEAALRGQPAA